MDYYVVLGIEEDASEGTIRSAFRALARRFHPDVGAGSSLIEFERAREAYETLVDPERRRGYDRQLRASRARPVSDKESMIWKPFAEPLFDSRRSSFSAAVPHATFFEDLVEEFFATLTDDRLDHDWLWGPRRYR